MSAALRQTDLPPVRGTARPDFRLADVTWLRVGGVADTLFTPHDADDLAAFLKAADVPVAVLGAGSNVLVRDGGIRGVVIRLGRGFGAIERDGATGFIAGAAVPDMALARAAAEAGVAGFAFYSGIPGTIGGALAMNAGAFGAETRDVLVSVSAITMQGERIELSADELKLGYRHNGLDMPVIYTAARFRGTDGDKAAIRKAMDEIAAQRQESQPIKTRTGGSTFRNPDGADPDGVKAWQLIDAAGCRGLTHGDAQMSEQHCNFLVNRGAATADDLETLGETVRERVAAQSGVSLDWEIRRMGERDAG